MSIDQTSQLIQLMLNSLLLMGLCGSIAIGLMVRQGAIVDQLRLLKPLYADAISGVRFLAPERLMQIKLQLRLLRRHHRLARAGGWCANGALMVCAGSTLLLALRTLILLDRLIPLSLLLFTCGAALLLLSLVLGLLSLVEGNPLALESEPRDERLTEAGLKSRRDRLSLPDRETAPVRPLHSSVTLARIGRSQSTSRPQPHFSRSN